MPTGTPKYISTDPNAGLESTTQKYLSTDPNAGQVAAPSKANWPVMRAAPSMGQKLAGFGKMALSHPLDAAYGAWRTLVQPAENMNWKIPGTGVTSGEAVKRAEDLGGIVGNEASLLGAPEAGASIAPRVIGMGEKIPEFLGSTRRGANLLRGVEESIGARPIANIGPAYQAAREAEAAAKLGGQPIKATTDLMGRVENPEMGPIRFGEGRTLYSNMGDISRGERMNLNNKSMRLLNQTKGSLGKSLQETAEAEGQGKNYREGLTAFRRAKRTQNFGRKAIKPALGLLGAGTAYEIGKRMASK